MPDISQTIVQLYRQLQHQGFTADELRQVASVYAYMTELCGNRYRATGKPFLDHLVGVAGITARYRPEITLVLAALAHSVYEEADFGTFWPKVTRGSQRELRNRLGNEVDQLARLYADLEWSLESATALPQRLAAMNSQEQDVVLLRVANELEEAVNLDLLFYNDERRQKKLALLQACSDMAGGLGYPELARAVIIANAELEKADARSLPDLGRAYSFNVGPRSYRKRLLPRLGRYLFRLRRRLSGP